MKKRIAVHRRLKKIACPVVQRQLGCDKSIANYFPAEYWLLEYSDDLDDLGVLELSCDELIELANDFGLREVYKELLQLAF